MDFGIFMRPGHYSWNHNRALIEAAEAAGFRYVWFGDSHLIWQEVSPYLTLAAMQSETLRFGSLVTNPVTRHPTVMASTIATLNERSNGRAILGLGRGDSAVRTLGLDPMRMAAFRTVSQQIKALCRGDAFNSMVCLSSSHGSLNPYRCSWPLMARECCNSQAKSRMA
jgi:alkanesulfonate monooxygenase SsuD/methylene tetrahydromethanopterin reductase-like flavin-dependent oxidoreductase (luciferase family)